MAVNGNEAFLLVMGMMPISWSRSGLRGRGLSGVTAQPRTIGAAG
jgi:hypothetical protein